MIKTALIGFVTLSGIGTGAMAAETVKPQTIELTAGPLMFCFDTDGVSTKVVDKSDYAVRLKTEKGRVIAIRF